MIPEHTDALDLSRQWLEYSVTEEILLPKPFTKSHLHLFNLVRHNLTELWNKYKFLEI